MIMEQMFRLNVGRFVYWNSVNCEHYIALRYAVINRVVNYLYLPHLFQPNVPHLVV